MYPLKQFFLLFLLSQACNVNGQQGEWTWMSGDSTYDSPAVFGTLGVSSPLNTPGGTYGPYIWIDDSSNLWIYGGLTYAQGTMWKYSITTNEWTWMSGPEGPVASLYYGIQGQFSPLNSPGNRKYNGLTWVDNEGNFWLYGGNNGYDTKSDLWKYDPVINQWAWINGSQLSGNPPVKNTYQTFDPGNSPGARFESSASWIDENGNFWFYGGHQNGSLGYFSDMWKYNPVSNQWAWMNGSITTNQLPVYGVQGIPSPNNSPGGRYVYSHWKECNYFWIFGGDKGVVYADLWRYDLTTNEWTWMSGTDQTNAPGVSGGECIGGMNYHPSGRHESRSNASDQCGNLWLFGGQTNGGTRNDLWVYQVSNNTWTFINGSLNTVSNGKYNTKGISSPTNSPSARFGSIMWNDSNGNFWMFGGEHLGGLQFCNDVWKFSPDPTCPPSPINCGECNFPIAGIIQSPLKFCQNSCIDFYDNSVGSVDSWLWQFEGANPLSSTEQNPTDVCYLTSGSFDVTLIIANAFGNDTLLLPDYVIVNPSPDPILSQNIDTLFCSNTGNYQWYLNSNLIPGETNNQLIITQEGSYIVLVTDSNGCMGSDTIEVFSIGSTGIASTDSMVCEKFCIDFFDQSTNNPSSWHWIFEGGIPLFSFSQDPANICYDDPGIYDVSLITSNLSGNDTLFLDNFITVYPTPPFPTITQDGYILTSSPSNSYQWQLNTIDILGATNQSYETQQTGYYTVIVSEKSGCKNSTTVYVQITGLYEININNYLLIYPNPASNSININYGVVLPFSKGSIAFCDVLGTTTFDVPISKESGEITLNIEFVPSGCYYLKLICENRIINIQKFFVVK